MNSVTIKFNTLFGIMSVSFTYALIVWKIIVQIFQMITWFIRLKLTFSNTIIDLLSNALMHWNCPACGGGCKHPKCLIYFASSDFVTDKILSCSLQNGSLTWLILRKCISKYLNQNKHNQWIICCFKKKWCILTYKMYVIQLSTHSHNVFVLGKPCYSEMH